jgi:hypothetical protein
MKIIKFLWKKQIFIYGQKWQITNQLTAFFKLFLCGQVEQFALEISFKVVIGKMVGANPKQKLMNNNLHC